jgi:hypothetical protein
MFELLLASLTWGYATRKPEPWANFGCRMARRKVGAGSDETMFEPRRPPPRSRRMGHPGSRDAASGRPVRPTITASSL